MRRMIIGLSGKAGSGKNFIADILQEKYKYNTISFADPLKRICTDVFKFSHDQLWGPSHLRNQPDPRWPRKCHECGGRGRVIVDVGEPPHWIQEEDRCLSCGGTGETFLTPREALQQLGTEWGRKCYENVWVDYTIDVAQKLIADRSLTYSAQNGLETTTSKYGGVTISDVRFKNEIEGIKKAHGKVIRIVRGETSLTGKQAAHSSETEQNSIPDSEFDDVLYNVDDIEMLHLSIDLMMRKICTVVPWC